eukprot:Protomagalhaensia_sp_Gyna_25__1428@NODE_1720_length_1588_cov_88_872176_g1409_i0_p2_GENE_NODE_1720_length_1588_cov_88_872176_g1409_i0NODE_1720_length_1588_cov_88_872176_g1409_i0_p2_ORF_typecomplete_len210_score10_47_NODE_1720_length_1588_cov_88_872176_g1409_i0202831
MLWVFYIIKGAVVLGVLRQSNKVLSETLACEESPEAVVAVDQIVRASKDTSDEAGVQYGLIKERPTLPPMVNTSPPMKEAVLERSPSDSLIARLPDLNIKRSLSVPSPFPSSAPTIETPGWIQQLTEATEKLVGTISDLGVDVSLLNTKQKAYSQRPLRVYCRSASHRRHRRLHRQEPLVWEAILLLKPYVLLMVFSVRRRICNERFAG